MITRAELTDIGRTIKPHGINGEIATAIDCDVDFDTLRCVVIDIDGIFVPFFINSTRWRGNEAALITIDGINDEKEAKELCGKTVYALKSDIVPTSGNDETTDNPDGFYAEDLIGYKVTADGHPLGEISDVDSSTENVLFIITTDDGKNIYIPVTDEFITDVDSDKHIIEMSLPQGLLEL